MLNKKLGIQTIKFDNKPVIISASSTVGKKEGEGPLGNFFDEVLEDDMNGCESWEQAESSILEKTLRRAVDKSKKSLKDIDYILCGDLLNQESASTFGIRKLDRPFFGVYGACSTMGEAMAMGSILVDGGYGKYALTGASSHFCSAERQFRFPLNLGSQRPPSSTWTVTGAGATVIASEGEGPHISYATIGKIVDYGITDANNMGAAMAPAAVNVITTHFKDTNTNPKDYDLIITGDLGYIGKEIVIKLCKEQGYDVSSNYNDCGIEIFDQQSQDTHSGGSGCACSATTFCGYYYSLLKCGDLKKILFVPTGAMMSTTSSQQGESIPGIAYGIQIVHGR